MVETMVSTGPSWLQRTSPLSPLFPARMPELSRLPLITFCGENRIAISYVAIGCREAVPKVKTLNSKSTSIPIDAIAANDASSDACQ